ncbi:hypothetical protein SODALDRAFT_303031 [Sodiomyces alkalinus F11]|uniref:Bactericidal permeability-increasing protein n=1 Tax=Sodiomyces alkalinus (strain CBS 110278 / VKM F-3762 / F11) TaxID=1314773 RepID=A0A3N2Q5I0_SODAK|nr:hypothetical protein SODALDRAFT_303031 [Sodiomyces alkalinus F11]ROT42030.1 hypothetical protein SODALDRAFT_303031 [Sodiomyces alkalinus F11]
MSVNVNKPTDMKQKEADVHRKLQLYGIISAFQLGKVPSNDQIDVALNSFLASKPISNPSDKLSEEGRSLVADARTVVKNAQHLLLSRNQGNLLQDFIWQTQHWDAKSLSRPGAPVDKQTAQQHGDQALNGLRTLGTLIITNGQFRKLLKDATVLLRDIAGDAATNAASHVRPSQEELADIDNPAQDNVWHDAPKFSKENWKQEAQNIYKGDPKKDLRDTAHAAKQDATAVGSQTLPQRSGRDGTAAASERQGVQQTTDANGNATGNLKERVEQNVDPETKEKIRKRNEEYRRKAREYLNKKVPESRRDQTVLRLKKMVLECQQHPDYSQAIETILDLIEQYSQHSRAIAEGGSGTVREARGGLAQAESDLRTLIERFANGTSTGDLWSHIGQIYRDADHDPELKNWFKAMNQYIRRCLLQQGYILEDSSNEEWNRLYDHGRYLLREKYRTNTDRVVDELRFIMNEFDNDQQNKAFGQSIRKLFNDLGNDENGKPVFKPHLVKDLTGVIIPGVLENLAYVPVPRIEYSDHQVDAVIENLVIESDNFTPNILEINSEHHFRWGRKRIANKNKQVFDVKVSGIQMDLRDVSYHIKRKEGFPSITDTGVADFLLAGEGLTFEMKCATADKLDSQNFFKIEKVDVEIKHMNVKLKQSNHKLLFKLFKPIMMKVLRPALQKVVEASIKDQANKLDRMLFQMKQEADRALEEARSDPEHVPNIYNRYYNAMQKRILQNREKAKEVAADKKFNMAITMEDSIFPNVKLPGGISTKATEYRELARKGERWESPVFSIGTANKSTDIPEAPKIQRKTHVPKGSPTGRQGGQDGFAGQHPIGSTQGGAYDSAMGSRMAQDASRVLGGSDVQSIPGQTQTVVPQTVVPQTVGPQTSTTIPQYY